MKDTKDTIKNCIIVVTATLCFGFLMSMCMYVDMVIHEKRYDFMLQCVQFATLAECKDVL